MTKVIATIPSGTGPLRLTYAAATQNLYSPGLLYTAPNQLNLSRNWKCLIISLLNNYAPEF